MIEHNFKNGICLDCGYSEIEYNKYGHAYACGSPMIHQAKNKPNVNSKINSFDNPSEYCPNGHGKMEPWNGELRCWKCGFTNQTRVQPSSHPNIIKTDKPFNANSRYSNSSPKKEIGFWDRLSGKGVEKLVDEYSEIYGEILLGMHRELTSQKKKLNDFGNDIKELGKLNGLFTEDTNINVERKYIIELAKRLAENIGKANNDNLRTVNEIKSLIEDEFKKINQSMTKNKESIAQTISEKTKNTNQQIQLVEEKIFQVNSSISKQFQENSRNFSIAHEKSELNKKILTKSLYWNRAFIILTFITSLTILGILLWKTNLL